MQWLRRLSRAALLPLLALAASGCRSTTEMVLNLSGSAQFFELPLPSDLRLDAQGHPQLSGFPNPLSRGLVYELQALAEEDVEGWSPSGPIYLRFTGPLDAARLPADPLAYVSTSSAIQLLDVDPASPERGRRFPLLVSFNRRSQSFRPGNLLQALPVQGIELREGTRYALIVLDSVPVPDGGQILIHPQLTALLQGRDPGGPLGPRAKLVHAPLAAQLALEGIDPARIAAATVFTTGTPTQRLLQIAEGLEDLPTPVPDGELRLREEFPLYYVLEGTWQLPLFQSGEPPYATELAGGVFQFDDAGLPAVQAHRSAAFVLTIPKRPMPAKGFPLLLYIHGTGGTSDQVYVRGRMDETGERERGGGPSQVAAQRGWASSGASGHLAPEHLGERSLDGYVVYNVFNPRAMRDNFMQLVAEHMLFRRLLLDLRIDPECCPMVDPSAAEDGRIRLDPTMNVVMGQSLGSYLAGMTAATDPQGYQGVILTGAGGSWVEFALGPRDPFELKKVIERLVLLMPPGESLDVWHPVLALFDLAAGPANNIHHVHTLLRSPVPGSAPPHVLVIEGYDDLQVPTNLQRPLVSALGVDFVGEDVGPYPEGQILDAVELAGREQLQPPVSANFELEGGGQRTAGVVRYLEDGILEGHYVVFQIEAAKHQYGCFLETLADFGTPVIVEGTRQGDPCIP